MPVTKHVSEVTEADRPFVYAEQHADGKITLYYPGDTVPEFPFPGSPPVVLTPRQFRQALNKTNLRASVEAAVAASKQDTKDWYQYATEFESTHPVLLEMANGLGKTQADIATLFALGATL